MNNEKLVELAKQILAASQKATATESITELRKAMTAARKFLALAHCIEERNK